MRPRPSGRSSAAEPIEPRDVTPRRVAVAQSAGHEVDQLLDPAEQAPARGRRSDATRAEDVLPGAGDVGLVAVRPAERLADALLPLDVARDRRASAVEAEPLRLHRLPRRRRTGGRRSARACRRASLATACGDPALLGARHQVVDEHADPALGPGPEVAQVLGEVVDAARGTPRRRPRRAGRRPRPSRPARRRGGPRRRSGWPGPPAPWRRARRPTRTPYAWARRGRCAHGRREDHRHGPRAGSRGRAGRCGACRAGPRG